MKHHHNIFTGAQVRALLDGSKTQDRRIIKGAPTDDDYFFDRLQITPFDRKQHGVWKQREFNRDFTHSCHVKYQVGDLLWVRENWRAYGDDHRILSEQDHSTCTGPDDIQFEASVDGLEWGMWRYFPSIHMPRWASRLTLKVTDVRVQRLHDISEFDAINEGSRPFFDSENLVDVPCPNGETMKMQVLKTPLDAYQKQWDEMHKLPNTTWKYNPWVVAYEFEVIKSNIDDFLCQ